eukprot:TRINITY_DN1872_c0_g1_i1.p1 TRINITY_DN1872_c0_g1~~TRINITY_DN1872_c0_g1_i1.p1  ORF type:complete len:283 (+),score=46.16 TRINITY_DN1872_c0_g1_i1:40-888(+)
MGKQRLIRSSEGSKRRAWLMRETSLMSVSGSPERRFVLQFVRLLKKKNVLNEHILLIVQWYQQVARFSTLMSYDLCIEKGGARVWQGCRRNIPTDIYQAAIEPKVPYNWSSELMVSVSNSKQDNRGDVLRVGVVNLPESTSDAASVFNGEGFPKSMCPKELQIQNVGSGAVVTIRSSPSTNQIRVTVRQSSGTTTVRSYTHFFKPHSPYSLFGRLSQLGDAIDIIGFAMHPPTFSGVESRFINANAAAIVLVVVLTCAAWGLSAKYEPVMRCSSGLVVSDPS